MRGNWKTQAPISVNWHEITLQQFELALPKTFFKGNTQANNKLEFAMQACAKNPLIKINEMQYPYDN